MKRPKPGFKIFIKTRLRHPLKFKDTLVYISASGERFLDKGSAITATVSSSIFAVCYFSAMTFSFKIWGLLLLAVVPVLHHFLRYFWTDFVKLDEENNPIEYTSLLIMKEPRKKPEFIVKLLKSLRKDYDGDRVRYKRYKTWQSALIMLVPLIVLAMLFWAGMLMRGTPYVRFHYYPYERIMVSQPVNSPVQAYEQVQFYINERIPGAELIGYSISMGKDDTSYEFLFRNPKRGIFMRDSFETASVVLSAKGNYFTCNFSDITLREAGLKTVAAPPPGLNTARITEIALKEAGVRASDMDALLIKPGFSDHASKYNYDPGGKTWAVEVWIEGYEIYFTVDLDKGTAIKESDNIQSFQF